MQAAALPPPAYSLENAPLEELPSYSGPVRPPTSEAPAFKEFSFGVKSTNGKTLVAELILLAPAALSKNLPTYLQTIPVSGRIILCLSHPEIIQDVTLSIQARVISINVGWDTNPESKTIFLNLSEKIWAAKTKDTKLTGKQEWPFSVSLPSEVSIPIGPGQAVQTFKLPETSSETGLSHSISYEVGLNIRRGRFKSDYRVGTSIGVIPSIRPGPSSVLMQLAYQENTPVLAPDLDPEGWYSCQTATLTGKLFGVRSISMKCTLSVATPLSYTRGSIIPLHLVLESDDEQAFDLLSSPESPMVRLRRIVKRLSGDKTSNSDMREWKDYNDDFRSASFLPTAKPTYESEVPQNTFKRHLYGEVHLDRNLKPTTSIANVRVDYFVVLLPFETPGFVPEVTGPLATIPVEIATLNAVGPRPRVYTKPKENDRSLDKYRVAYGLTLG